MLGPGQVLRIDGDMAALAVHADRIAAAGAGIERVGGEVHRRWQGLAAVYVAPETGELLAATGPVATVSAAVAEDCAAAAAALRAYAAEVGGIQAGLDALRASTAQLLDDMSADRSLFDRDVANHAEHAALVARWELAQLRCAGALDVLTGGGARPAGGVEPAVGRFSAARFGAAPPAPAPEPGFLDTAGAVGSFVLDFAAATGEAIAEHPLEALGVGLGAALVVAGAAGEVVGVGADATGIGLPVGLSINAGSAAVIVAGVGLAGVSGAAILDATLDNLAAAHPAVGAATAPTMIDANGAEWDRNRTWEPIPSARPAGEDIAHDASSRAHIPYGEDRPDGSVGGGHWYGSGRAGKTVFPEPWTPERILEETLDVARNPDRTPAQRQNGTWEVEGTRDGVEIRVVLKPDGTIVTGHPLGGAGVAVNDEYGDPQPIN
jgi:Bacterial EndoU nuclease